MQANHHVVVHHRDFGTEEKGGVDRVHNASAHDDGALAGKRGTALVGFYTHAGARRVRQPRQAG